MAWGSGDGHAGGFDSQLATLRHRIARIDGQVEKNLLELTRVSPDFGNVVTQGGGQADGDDRGARYRENWGKEWKFPGGNEYMKCKLESIAFQEALNSSFFI